MAEFTYQARDTKGTRHTGVVRAGDPREAADSLRSQGLYVVALESDRSISGIFRAFSHRREATRKVPLRDLAVFFRQFVTLFGAGVPVRDGIATLVRQSSNPVLIRLLRPIIDDLNAGEPLSVAFEKRGQAFPPLVASMLRAGEATGALADIGERLATQFEREDAMARKLRAAVSYPAAVMVVAFCVLTFLLTVVIPNFSGFFSQFGAPLPWPTIAILVAGDFMRRWFWLIGIVLVASGLFAMRKLSTEQGMDWRDRFILRLPYFGPLTLKRVTGRMSRTLATLLAGGLPVLEALDVTKHVVENRAMAAAVNRCRDALEEGGTLHAQLRDEPLFPAMVSEMVAAGEETGTVDVMLTKVADFYDSEVETTLARMTSLLEPALIVVLGVIVGAVIVAVIWPIFDVLKYV